MPTPNKGESKQDYLKRCTADVVAEGKDSDQAYAMCNAFWDDAHNCRPVMNLTAPVEFKKAEKNEPRKFMITGYTGEQIETWWGTIVFELAGRMKIDLPEGLRPDLEGYNDWILKGMGITFQDLDRALKAVLG